MFFANITSQPEPFPGKKTGEALLADLRLVVMHSIFAAGGDGKINAKMVSIKTTLTNSTDRPLYPVHVLLFTSDQKWVALDNKKRMEKFMANALSMMPVLADGNLAVDVVPMEHFVSK
jgi:hypothetical protein